MFTFLKDILITKAYADGLSPITVGLDKSSDFLRADFQNPVGLIGGIIEILFIIVWVLAVVYLIIGGYQYITAGGNPDAAAKAKNTIVGSIIGLIVAIASFLIVRFIIESLGGK